MTEEKRPTRAECEGLLAKEDYREMHDLTRAYLAQWDENEALVKAMEVMQKSCLKCKGRGYVDGQHKEGYTHYETDAGEACPAYHFEFVPCSVCAPINTVLAEYAKRKQEREEK